ncbi:MAG: ABC transporter ATP-binding protein [Candidatus Orphnella occulta]|nr:ABC transporter ATP-binding protein [Candidatus Orphnella occulta]
MDFLNVVDLKSGYKNNLVLNEISFSVKKGEFIGIIGPNGAGKTTLLKTLSHIIRPLGGKVFLKGKDIHLLSSLLLARECAMVGQDLLSLFSFTVEEIVLMGRNPYLGLFKQERKEDVEIVNMALKRTDMSLLKDRPIDELSAGERQRALIAKALVQQPQLLLLDEPTAHLDIGYQTDILDLIRLLNRDSELTVICVLHDLNLASQYCDKLLLLDKGKIAGFGPPAEILQYDILERTFNARCLVDKDILGGKPIVIPFPKNA